MLNQPTIEKLHTMKLHGMADAFRAQLETADASQLGFEERFAHARRSAVALERKPRAGAASSVRQTERARRHRRHRLPASARPRPQADAHAVGERMGAAAPERSADRADRHRQDLVGLRAGAEGLPRRLLRRCTKEPPNCSANSPWRTSTAASAGCC